MRQMQNYQHQLEEALNEYLQILKQPSGGCNYNAVSVEKCKEAICNAFISTRIYSPLTVL